MKHIKLFEDYDSNPAQKLIDPSVDAYSDGYHSIFETLIKTPGAKGYPVNYSGGEKRWEISWNCGGTFNETPIPGSKFSAVLGPHNPGKGYSIVQNASLVIYIATKEWSRISEKLKSQLGEPTKEPFDVSPATGFGPLTGGGFPIVYILDKSTAVTVAKFLEEIKTDLIK